MSTTTQVHEVPIKKAVAIIILTIVGMLVLNGALGFVLNRLKYDTSPLLSREISNLEKEVARGFRTPEKFIELGSGYHKLGEYDKAEKAFKDALKIDKENLSALYNLSLVYIDMEKYDDAIKNLKKITIKSPRHAQSYLNIGIAYQKKKDYKNALGFLNKTLLLEPRLNEARYYLGQVYEAKKDKKTAKEYYKEALRRDPGYEEAQQALAALK